MSAVLRGAAHSSWAPKAETTSFTPANLIDQQTHVPKFNGGVYDEKARRSIM